MVLLQQGKLRRSGKPAQAQESLERALCLVSAAAAAAAAVLRCVVRRRPCQQLAQPLDARGRGHQIHPPHDGLHSKLRGQTSVHSAGLQFYI